MSITSQSPRLLVQVRDAVRRRHYSYRAKSVRARDREIVRRRAIFFRERGIAGCRTDKRRLYVKGGRDG